MESGECLHVETRPIRMGILGGMGPLATSFFFDRIIRHTDADRDQDHIDICILNRASMPDRTDAIRAGQEERFIALAVEDCRRLESLGVDYIAIPCNTSHYFYDAIQKRLTARLIHMVRETVLEAKRRCPALTRLGVMATDGTVMTDVYGRECRREGIEAVYPSRDLQKEVMRIIYDEVKKGRRGEEDRFYRVVAELLQAGCERIVLACTELSYFKQYYELPDYLIDAMDVLVRRFIELSGKKYKE